VPDPTAPDHAQGPLSSSELQQLEATLLPALERHHLRLLAHALRTLREIQQSTGESHMPQQAAIEQWLLAQPGLGEDAAFGRQLSEQLSNAGRQLEELAQQRGVKPLELDLDALINWARQQADQRLAIAPPAPPPEPPTGPPADR
jgi:aryl-alcohol dehydrogenase-like predicted oxidoreductase